MKLWTIRIEDANLQGSTFALQSKGDCYLSANTKLVGFDKALAVSSEELAQRFLESVMPTMRRRHGTEVSLSVAHCEQSKKRPLDDVLVIARIEQANFVPNKPPPRIKENTV